ncbi:MAG: ribbon-helix-helix protein, CopG family [Azospirillum sp.]|nr:ribbon-helix-helix protein, CopG family [Azospirillum sp.]
MKPRLNVYFEPALMESLAALAAQRRLSRSSIVEAALASFLSPDAADRREAAFVRRLDRISRQIERLERDTGIAVETLALFVQFFLSVTPPVPEGRQDAARALGNKRYQDFVESLGRRLAQGRSLIREVSEELYPESRATIDDEGDHAGHA